jgi:hypothetical protein
MSLEIAAWALRQEVGHPELKLVLIGFCNSFDRDTGKFDASIENLAKFSCMSSEDTTDAFLYLIEDGWIEGDADRGYNLVWERGVDPWAEMVKRQKELYPELFLKRLEPAKDAAPPPDWIYVLHCEGLVKVGISANVKNRIAQIRQEGPEKRKAKLFYKEQCTPENIRKAETMAHGMLARRINRSDWFCDTPANAIMAVTEALAKVRGAA